MAPKQKRASSAKKKLKLRGPQDRQAVPLSKARRLFSPLVSELSRHSRVTIPITVRGEVRAYLVAAERFEQLEISESTLKRKRPPPLAGTLAIGGDLEEASREFRNELEEAALRRARRVGFP